jgi:hypothetical protein
MDMIEEYENGTEPEFRIKSYRQSIVYYTNCKTAMENVAKKSPERDAVILLLNYKIAYYNALITALESQVSRAGR